MRLTVSAAIAAAVIGLCAAPVSFAQQAGSEPAAARLLIRNLPTTNKLTVTSPGFQNGGDITGAGFPGLTWTAGPADTRGYAVIVQDTHIAMDTGEPMTYLAIFNVPASVTKLDPGLTTLPEGARFGPSDRGKSEAWAAPSGAGSPKHHYHFQVFALRAQATSNPAKSFAEVMAGLYTSVLASGEIVGLAAAPK